MSFLRFTDQTPVSENIQHESSTSIDNRKCSGLKKKHKFQIQLRVYYVYPVKTTTEKDKMPILNDTDIRKTS